ncbi:MAG: LysE family translocator [Acidimicrobiaceae bacterium]
MSILQVIPGFALTALFLAMVPGQGVAMILRQTIIGGSRCAYLSVLGNTTGLIIWGALSSVGLSAVFAHSHLAFNLLKFTGVAYLSFLSIQTLFELRNDFGKFDYNGKASTNSLAAFRLGLFTNLTNVKAAVFAVAFIPLFVPNNFNLGVGIMVLVAVQAIVSTTWYFSLVAAIDKASVILAEPRVRRWLTGISAVGLLTLAIVLLFTPPR